MINLIEAAEKIITRADQDPLAYGKNRADILELRSELVLFLYRLRPLSKKLTLLSTFAGFSKSEVEAIQKKLSKLSGGEDA